MESGETFRAVWTTQEVITIIEVSSNKDLHKLVMGRQKEGDR